MQQIQIPAPVAATVTPTVAKQSATPASALRFVLLNRPAAGNGGGYLAAHTAAAFEALGLFNGAAVSRQTLARVWGQTAIGWHTGGSGKPSAFERYHAENGAEMLELNKTGIERFAPRNTDPEKIAFFFDLLTEGKAENAPQAFKAVKPL